MAGLEIVLPTNFRNPLLPKVPVSGFRDNFNRADTVSGLGETSEEWKSWENFTGINSTLRGRISGGRAVSNRQAGGWSADVVDAQSPNGTLKATLVAAGNKWGGLTLRASKNTDFITLMLRSTTTNTQLSLNKKVDNVGSVVATAAVPDLATEGSVFEVIMAGPNITVLRNGVIVIPTQTIPEFTTATRHGLYWVELTDGVAWDDIQFIAE